MSKDDLQNLDELLNFDDEQELYTFYQYCVDHKMVNPNVNLRKLLRLWRVHKDKYIAYCVDSGFDYEVIEYPVPDLLGLAEVAELLGWSKSQVNVYRSRGKFPEPLQELASGPIWTKEQIERYIKKRGK